MSSKHALGYKSVLVAVCMTLSLSRIADGVTWEELSLEAQSVTPPVATNSVVIKLKEGVSIYGELSQGTQTA